MARHIHVHVHARDSGEFESKHPRGAGGRFGEGTGDVKAPTKARAEATFMFGGCASFAVALQSVIGGELFSLYSPTRKQRDWHVVVKRDGELYDVQGKRSKVAMVRSFTGDPLKAAEFDLEGPRDPAHLPFPVWEKEKAMALAYIKANPKLFAI